MEAYSGDVYALREELVGDAKIGEPIDRERMVARLREVLDATEDERKAAEHDLVRIGEPAARKLMLGNREQRRRRQRRKRR